MGCCQNKDSNEIIFSPKNNIQNDSFKKDHNSHVSALSNQRRNNEYTFGNSPSSRYSKLNENKIDPNKINYIDFKETNNSLGQIQLNLSSHINNSNNLDSIKEEKDIFGERDSKWKEDTNIKSNIIQSNNEYDSKVEYLIIKNIEEVKIDSYDSKKQIFYDKLSKLKINTDSNTEIKPQVKKKPLAPKINSKIQMLEKILEDREFEAQIKNDSITHIILDKPIVKKRKKSKY